MESGPSAPPSWAGMPSPCSAATLLGPLLSRGRRTLVAGGKLVRLDRQYAVIAINGAEQVFHRRPNSTESLCRGGCVRCIAHVAPPAVSRACRGPLTRVYLIRTAARDG
jgi:hypothetical protein